ncbi:hypothetical protein E5F05_13200 [Deinococcus metallilatus]|uniref:Lipoprotein n=1 Tax=Deinococcus metallilatus TaxID=1211322 RepID=A0AAJ5F538_9DEIO|nr:hypothetical protein [Deinococcus metallilatus]MBB5294018.1 hypothetical protein [Deinococcus metallilatus]QBY08810.1 hypothetical protein E5F05_13200 [Deinococcus metallilatus]RXJ09954.1 hypothetical protein ERJ73_12030 [Deinococcus metallilatus]TLK28109.1 hypothetical protein FCS05_09350 [Deinococcus metallilatus]GMA16649.1 hypothetical protein GCM10025871_29800 [Deinococcus metallilatus]
MPRPALVSLLLAVTLCACAPGGVRELHFRPEPAGSEPVAARLLTEQRVPEGRLLSVKEAVARAPAGSLLVVCGARWQLSRPWGLCSHLSRKLAPGLLTEAPGIFGGGLLNGGVQTVPETRLEKRDVVIVLDVGVREDQLPALRAEAARLSGTPYRVAGLLDRDGGLDCATYQNALQRALGLPDAVPFNSLWNLYLPQDALKMPGARVLWVGVRGG